MEICHRETILRPHVQKRCGPREDSHIESEDTEDGAEEEGDKIRLDRQFG